MRPGDAVRGGRTKDSKNVESRGRARARDARHTGGRGGACDRRRHALNFKSRRFLRGGLAVVRFGARRDGAGRRRGGPRAAPRSRFDVRRFVVVPARDAGDHARDAPYAVGCRIRRPPAEQARRRRRGRRRRRATKIARRTRVERFRTERVCAETLEPSRFGDGGAKRSDAGRFAADPTHAADPAHARGSVESEDFCRVRRRVVGDVT